MDEEFTSPRPKKRNGNLKYVIYLLIVLLATGLSLFFALYGNFNEVVDTILSSKWQYLLLIMGIVLLSYCVDALIILVFCRLYTKKYRFHQGLACSLVGQFYSNVTPGSSGGQVMQVYTLKSQGVPLSNGASIFVMWFIIYQFVLIVFDLVAFFVEMNTILSIPDIPFNIFGWQFSIPIWPIVILGFLLNISVIFLLIVMSFSHRFHNFIIHYVIGFLAKIRIVKNPDKARESIRVQVENFKIELRRLMSNIPVLILQIVFFSSMIVLRSSVPYFAGMAVQAFTDFNFGVLMDGVFRSAFHQMVTGIIPLPGSAGVSEFFYNAIFNGYFSATPNSVILNSTQIIWRAATFHIMFLISGLVAAFYRSRPKEPIHYANRQTFVDLQLATFDERKKSSDTLYETRQLSRRALQKKITSALKGKKNAGEIYLPLDEDMPKGKDEPEAKKEPTIKPKKPAKPKRKSRGHKEDSEDWEYWSI